MDWKGRRKSNNVEDRRGIPGGGLIGGAGIVGVVIYLITTFMSGGKPNVNEIINQVQGSTNSNNKTIELTSEQKELGNFVSTVFADTEDTWHTVFSKMGKQYREPKMVLFTGSVTTKCGNATSAVGPFYCPADEKVYMDLDFFEELRTRFGAQGGDYAIAYVIAHEVGHHVQHLLGINAKVNELSQGKSKTYQNKLSVSQELQADFFAGIFSHHTKKYIQEGDIEEALSAAHAVGDDAIQKKMNGEVNPDSFTHGTSEQRKKWFLKGFESGDINQGDTFAGVF